MINKNYPSALHWEWVDDLDEYWLFNGQVRIDHLTVAQAANGKWIAGFGVYGPGYPIEEVTTAHETLKEAQLACEDFFELENGEFPIIWGKK